MKKVILSFILLISAILPLAVAETLLVINDNGVGPINKNTPYNFQTLQRLLPNLRLRNSVEVSEGEPYGIIVAYRHHLPQVTLVPTADKKNIFCIAVTSKSIKNAFGITLGTPYEKIYANTSKPNCIPAQEEMSGLVICTAPQAKNIAYVFARNKRWNKSDGVLPPYNVIKDWTLKQITWMRNDADIFKDHQLCKSEDIFANYAPAPT